MNPLYAMTGWRAEREVCMDAANVVSLTRPERPAHPAYDRLRAELDDLSLYKLVRRARREGTPIRTRPGDIVPPSDPESEAGP